MTAIGTTMTITTTSNRIERIHRGTPQIFDLQLLRGRFEFSYSKEWSSGEEDFMSATFFWGRWEVEGDLVWVGGWGSERASGDG